MNETQFGTVAKIFQFRRSAGRVGVCERVYRGWVWGKMSPQCGKILRNSENGHERQALCVCVCENAVAKNVCLPLTVCIYAYSLSSKASNHTK